MGSVQGVYEATTAAIVQAIEEGAGVWHMPWQSAGVAFPTNPTTKKRYGGGNVVGLWAAAMNHGYSFGQWATFKQWAGVGAQVRRGEKGTGALFFTKREDVEATNSVEDDQHRRFIARSFTLFNVAQVEGYAPTLDAVGSPEQIDCAETFFGSIGAKVEHRHGVMPCYRPGSDDILLPPQGGFDTIGDYYGTAAHEHAHWTGHPSRLARDFSGRFGGEAYAVEELTAELSAAFTCALLGISPTPRPDHAAYLAAWLKVLKSDVRALHAIAGKAQGATDYLARAAGHGEATECSVEAPAMKGQSLNAVRVGSAR